MSHFFYKVFRFFASLRLTVATLSLALILVFAGTIAQVKLGLYTAQKDFFSSLFIFWGPQGASWKIPVFPGGYLLGGVLLLNLVAAHFDRWSPSKKKIGISIIHAGLVVMFLGQFTTQLLQVESFMLIPEGGSSNYSQSDRRSEIVVVDASDPKTDKVVSIPDAIIEKRLRDGGEITHPDLPFALRVKNYRVNSRPSLEKGELKFEGIAVATAMDDRDIPAVDVEAVVGGSKKGEWTLSNWLAEEHLFANISSKLGARAEGLGGPKEFEFNGKKYLLMMRSQRFYKPFKLSLINFKFDRYMGTGVAKNFSSDLILERPDTGEKREIHIRMNTPLRYGGETYFQQSFTKDEKATILQVVSNPSWLTPYVACVMVSVGLLWQFLGHLVGFARRRTA
jgi:hypothetical protein